MKKFFCFALALAAIALISCKKEDTTPTSVPDTLFNTYWLGTTTTAKWELLFPSEKTSSNMCYIITTMYDTQKEKTSRYTYQYNKPLLQLTPYDGSEERPSISGTVSYSTQGLAITLNSSEAGWTEPIVVFYTPQDSLEETRAGLLR